MKELRRKIARLLSGRPLALVVYWLIRLLYASMRITVIGEEIFPGFARRNEGYIGIFWHGRLLMIRFADLYSRVHVLISTHRDGEIIASVMKCFGCDLVRGSHRKGGAEALREMVRILKDGGRVAITPDGPRGPAELLKPGVAQLARLSGKAVVPLAFSASHFWRLSSWDRFLIPKPFSRGVLVVGEPIRYQSGEDAEAFRLRIEQALHDVTKKADSYFK